jgi:hypothetical protein
MPQKRVREPESPNLRHSQVTKTPPSIKSPQVKATLPTPSLSGIQRKIQRKREEHFGPLLHNPTFFDLHNETEQNRTRNATARSKFIQRVQQSTVNPIHAINAERYEQFISHMPRETKTTQRRESLSQLLSPQTKTVNLQQLLKDVKVILERNDSHGGRKQLSERAAKIKKPTKGKKQ